MSGNWLNETFGLKYPLIQGGMARVATGAFAAAVSNAGALGVIGSGSMEPEHLRDAIAECRGRLAPGKPFGVNLMMMNPHCDVLVEIIIEEKVPVVTTGAGSPAPYVADLQSAGIRILPVVASPLMAVRMERLGVDGIIAEGCEAGGHVGSLTTMSLLPQVVDAVSLPVIAAGGICSGRQIVAALALGAVGVQLGTLLLAADECPIHDHYRELVLKAKAEDVMTVGRIGGTPTQMIKNALARQYLKMEKEGAPWEDLERFALGGLRRAVVEGDAKEGAFMAGQSVGLVKTSGSLEEIFYNLGVEAEVAALALGSPEGIFNAGNQQT